MPPAAEPAWAETSPHGNIFQQNGNSPHGEFLGQRKGPYVGGLSFFLFLDSQAAQLARRIAFSAARAAAENKSGCALVKRLSLCHIQNMADKRLINFNATAAEDALLTAYAAQTGRTKTDLLREFIRSLEVRPKKANTKRAKAK